MQGSAKRIRAMNSCVVCKKYSAFCDSDGVCEKCAALRPITVRFVEKQGLMPVRSDGKVLSEDEWYRLQSQVSRFYMHHEQEWIDEQNKKNKEIRHWAHTHKNSPGVPGYVYLLKASNGYFKIGRAFDVNKRLKGHKRMYPLQIDVLHTVYSMDMVKAENHLLKRFEEYKMQGEWFLLEPDHVEWICGLTSEELDQVVASASK